MTLFIRSIYIAVLISSIYISLLYFSDSYKRESLINVGIAFIAGMGAVVIVTVFNAGLPWLEIKNLSQSRPILSSLYRHFFRAGTIEELAKLLLFFLTVWKFSFSDFSEPYDGMVYMGLLGAGFAVYEDFFYIFNTSYPPWIEGDTARFHEAFKLVVSQRAFPGHILFNAISGFFYGKARFSNHTWKWILGGTLLAIFFHGSFNFIGTSGGSGWLIIYVIALVALLLVLRDELRKKSPYRKIEQLDRTPSLVTRWKIISQWEFLRSIAQYRTVKEEQRKTNLGLFPIFISLVILYPLFISAIFYLNKTLIYLFELVY